MSRRIFSCISATVLGLSLSAAAMADDADIQCTAGSSCVGNSVGGGAYANEAECAAASANDCLARAQSLCSTHGGVSSYNCTSCAYGTAPKEGREGTMTRQALEGVLTNCPMSGQASGWYAYLTYQCAD